MDALSLQMCQGQSSALVNPLLRQECGEGAASVSEGRTEQAGTKCRVQGMGFQQPGHRQLLYQNH